MDHFDQYYYNPTKCAERMEQSIKQMEDAMGQLLERVQQREVGKLPSTVEKCFMVKLTVSEDLTPSAQVTQGGTTCSCCKGKWAIP